MPSTKPEANLDVLRQQWLQLAQNCIDQLITYGRDFFGPSDTSLNEWTLWIDDLPTHFLTHPSVDLLTYLLIAFLALPLYCWAIDRTIHEYVCTYMISSQSFVAYQSILPHLPCFWNSGSYSSRIDEIFFHSTPKLEHSSLNIYKWKNLPKSTLSL